MDKRRKDLLLENLSAAALLGVMGLFVASLAFVFDRSKEASEAASISAFAGSGSLGPSRRLFDSSASKAFPVSRKGKQLYGVVANLGDHRGVARVAFLFNKDGSLDSAGILEAVPQGQPFSRDGWFAEFLGKGGQIPFPRGREELKKADAVSGATDSFELTSDTLERLSTAVAALESTGQKDKD